MDKDKVTQKEVEIETVKTFIQNKGEEFSDSLIDYKGIEEPCDIKYKGINYQITIGDKKEVEGRRKVTSRGSIYTNIRNIHDDISTVLLRDALSKKSMRSSENTVLLIEVSSTGNLSWEELEKKFSEFVSNNQNLCGKWKEIYAVFPERNIQLH